MSKKDISSMKKILKRELSRRGINRASIFGSVARDEYNDDSDIDVLIEPSKNMSLMDLSGLKLDLEGILERKVDIATYGSIHPRLRRMILSEQDVIF